ncbi:MAG: PilZ domain-containing protein [Deltaproteobacteria bacterium]|nr:PilZ domain-containing protein [Deltaproteobacteria bacterium]
MKVAEKRRAVRIDSRVLFAVRQVSDAVFQRIKQDYNDGISLYNRPEMAEARLFVGAGAALSRLRERDEDMALVLQHIDAKLNKLLKASDDHHSLMDKLVLQRVNLAGNGLAFWSGKSYEKGEMLEFHIVLPADSTFIDCFGEVVHCTAEKVNGSLRQKVSCHLRMITEDDREALIQFNFKQQSLALQRRRMEQEGD